jgi:hypothetical protein
MSEWFVRGIRTDGPWESIPPEPEPRSLDAVRLVTQAPEFLGKGPGGLRRAALKAPGSNSGQVLVAVDEAGGVTLVACPKDEESDQGPLVTELLAASGGLWHRKIDVLVVTFQNATGRTLVDHVKARAGAGWSEEEFKQGIEDSLKQGKFPVIVVVKERTKAVDDMLGYLDNLNLKAKVIGYRCYRGRGVEAVEPVVLREGGPAASRPQPEPEKVAEKAPEPVPEKKPESAPVRRPEPVPEKKPEPQKQPEPGPRPVRKPAEADRSARLGAADRRQFVADSTRSTVRRVDQDLDKYPPFEVEGASVAQKEILRHLVPLDALGLERRGLEYFVPGAGEKETSEGSVIVAADHKRWPFPKENEVVVVVRTDKQHLAGFLDVPPGDIEDFLGSMPRNTAREHKNTLLLQATSVNEADQLVNEIRTLLGTFGSPRFGRSAPTPTPKPKTEEMAPVKLAEASPRQQEILAELEKLEHLGLKHEGMGFYLPGSKPETADGPVIGLMVDPGQWPKPDKDQVIVAVNPGEKHMSRYLSIPPDEIREFLGSLPQADRSDDRGCVLLLAANVEAGTQITNELKALRDIAQTGY